MDVPIPQMLCALAFGKEEADSMANSKTIAFTEQVIGDVISIHAAWLTGYVRPSSVYNSPQWLLASNLV